MIAFSEAHNTCAVRFLSLLVLVLLAGYAQGQVGNGRPAPGIMPKYGIWVTPSPDTLETLPVRMQRWLEHAGGLPTEQQPVCMAWCLVCMEDLEEAVRKQQAGTVAAPCLETKP